MNDVTLLIIGAGIGIFIGLRALSAAPPSVTIQLDTQPAPVPQGGCAGMLLIAVLAAILLASLAR